MKKQKNQFRMPTAFTVLILLTIVVAIITQFIPAITPATAADVIMAPIDGFASAMGVALFVLILGGFLGVVMKTGALNAGITAVAKKLNGKETWMIPVLMFLISLGGTTYGMAGETIAFYALVTSTMVAAGLDSLTAASTILLGSTAGVLGSTVNPFSISASVAALNAAGIETNQTVIILVGGLSWLLCYAVGVTFVMRYAHKVKGNKAASLLTSEEWAEVEKEYGGEKKPEADSVFTLRQKIVMVLFGLSFVVMIVGMVPWSSFGIHLFDHTGFLTRKNLGDWYFSELTAWFLLMGIVIGLVYGLKERDIVNSFLTGAGDLIGVALVIAVSRGVSVIMSNTGLNMYILEKASEALQGTSSLLFTGCSYVVYLLLSVLIPSSSGLATVSMPIMGPLAQNLGLVPEIMVCVLSGACALVNGITPTSGTLMGAIAICRIEYTTWVKYIWKPLAMMLVLHIVILSVGMAVL